MFIIDFDGGGVDIHIQEQHCVFILEEEPSIGDRLGSESDQAEGSNL